MDVDPKPHKMWYSFALLDFGDHGLRAARRNPERVGVIELTDRIKWVPGAGVGWDAPLYSTSIRTPRGFLGLLFDGLELEVFGVGIVRVRAMQFEPGVAIPRVYGALSDARATGKLRKQLVKRGAPVAVA